MKVDHERPPLWLLLVWWPALGAVAFGAGCLVGWLLYGTPGLTSHLVPLAVTAVLAVTAGVVGERLLVWLIKDLPPGGRRG